jgi:hypothetical protein
MELEVGSLLGFLEPVEVAMSVSRHQLWARRMDRYQACSLTVKEFCRREGVSVPSFYQWKKKLARASAEPTFVRVSLPQQSAAPVTVKLPGGAEVRIEAMADSTTLRRVLAAVIAETASGAER